MKNQIVILAAGKGKRLGTSTLPKVLLPLQGKPLIRHLLDEVDKLGKSVHPVIVIGYKHSAVQEALGKKYAYAIQREQLGTAHAVWAAKEKIQAENILVLYGDVPFIKAKSLEQIMKLHERAKAKISMFTSRVPDYRGRFSYYSDLARIIRDKFGNIIKIVEYKDATPAILEIKEVNPGIYMFNSNWLWEHIDRIHDNNAQHEFYLTEIIEVAIESQEPVHSLSIDPREIIGINTTAQLREVETLAV
jgi:bifunctional UDP-N-acetylglucosamine pyrophosphorylase/glucosamine-1-phosphate N-acetyltransferase